MKNNETFKFDLTTIVKDEKQYKELIETLKTKFETLLLFRGQLKNKAKLLEFLKKEEEFSKICQKLSVFVELKHQANIKDTDAIEKDFELQAILEKFSKELVFSEIEMSKLSNSYLDELIRNKDFKDYVLKFMFLKKEKAHILSEKEEKILHDANLINDSVTVAQMLGNEIKFESIKKEGKEFELNTTNYNKYTTDLNEDVRRQAFFNLHYGFGKFNLSFANNYVSELKYVKFFAKSYKFDSRIEQEFFYEEVEQSFFDNLISSVNRNLKLFFKFAEIRRISMKKEKIAVFDFFFPIHEMQAKRFSFKQAIEILTKATSIFGDEYVKQAHALIDQKRIDVFPKKNKRSGAFEISAGEGKAFVFLNYMNDFHSVCEFAHEMGHAMHSFFSETNQSYPMQETKVFLAEIASTVNELLIKRYMLKTANEEMKKSVAELIAQDFYSTVFRQTMFAEFEKEINDRINKDIPVHFEILNQTYLSLMKKYFGDKVEIPDDSKYEWSRIPHFYCPFYVYKYAIGMLVASLIVKKLENEKGFEKKYIKFLSAGSNGTPAQILKVVDIDLTDPKTLENGFDMLKEAIDVLQKKE